MPLGAELQANRVQFINGAPSFSTPLSFTELEGFDYGALREALNTDLNALGWPQQPRKVALLDGMADGTALSNQGFGPGQKYYDASIYANNANFGTVFKVAMRSSNTTATEKYRINGMDNCGKWWIEEPFSNSLFAISQPHDFDPCNIVILNADKVPHRYYTVSLRSNADLPALDNAPAGYRTDLTTIHASIQSGATAGDVTFNNPIRFPILSFVPT